MKPAVRQLLMGSAGQWRNTLPALRAFVTANYDQPNPHNQAAMASPPTIATSTSSTLLTGLGVSFRYSLGGQVLYTGGRAEGFGSGQYRLLIPATRSLATGRERNGVGRVQRMCNSAKVGFLLLGDATPYRFLVDDVYVSTAGTTTASSSGANYVTLDFAAVGGQANRKIAVETQNSQGFDGLFIAAGDTSSAVDPNFRILWLGDSFVGGSTGATVVGDGFAAYASDMLGIRDFCLSGVGSTGWVKNGTANDRYALVQRITDATTTGPWDVIVVAMGINDIGLSTSLISGQVNLTLKTLRQASPGAQIFAIGPWDVNAPAAPVANYAATKAAIQAGIPANSGVFFLDPEGVAFTKADATHPDDAGHATLGEWAALNIKNALGA